MMKGILSSYWPFREDLTIQDGLLMYCQRMVVPTALGPEILDGLHEAHQGITKIRLRAQSTVWWPGINKDILE